MKKLELIDIALVSILFLSSVFVWSIPIRNIQMPYGEPDSTHHFGVSDYFSQNDKIADKYPLYLYFAYAHATPNKEGAIVYPPQFFINMALFQMITNERIFSYFFFLAIIDSFVVLCLYFLMSNLYGRLIGFASSFLLIFSKIDLLTHMMGQYVVLISLSMVPLILYAYYEYTKNYLSGQNKPIYLYVIAFLLSVQFLTHFQAIAHSIITLALFTIFLIIKERKLPFNIKHAIIAIIVFAIVLGPFIVKPVEYSQASGLKSVDVGLGDLFKWYSSGYTTVAVSKDIFSYSAMHASWTLPFLFIGVFLLILKREKRDLLILSWLIAVYLILHFDILLKMNPSRVFRSINDVAHIFYPIVAIGFINICEFIKTNEETKKYIKYGLTILFILLILIFNAHSSYSMLKDSYSYPMRLNPYQYEAANWIKSNLPEDSLVLASGTLTQKVSWWLRVTSQRQIFEDVLHIQLAERDYPQLGKINPGYLLFDYSELYMLRQQEGIDQLQTVEKNMTVNSKLLYDKNYVKVYEIG